jgi:pimeloyl-ACP methyl ester carboxylesterase
MAVVPFRGAELSYQWFEHPSSPLPPLVALHGFLEDSRMWANQIEPWKSQGSVLLIDLPGHGKTPSFGYEHTMEFMADAVHAVCDALDLKRIALLGHSMGGYVALAFAAHFSEFLCGLGLFFSTPEADSEERIQMRFKAAELVVQNHNAFVRASIPQLFDPEARVEFKEAIDQQIKYSLEMPAQGIVAAIHGMRQRPDREILLHCPPKNLEGGRIAVFAGIHDTVIPFERVKQWWNAPGVGKTYTSPHGHMGHITDAQGCTDAVLQWWQQL